MVCDVDADLEGEDACGSIDVEERNIMARTAVTRADAVLAVGNSSLKGVHSLVRVITAMTNHGVDPERIVPVLNRSSRSPRTRATLGTALAELARPVTEGRLASAVHLPERDIDNDLHDGRRLPTVLADPLAGALAAVLERAGDRSFAVFGPGERVRPGSLGAWDDDEEAAI